MTGVFNLPQDIFPGKIKPEGIIFHNYSAAPGSFKGKSILHMNAISLVIQGEKKMFFADKTVSVRDSEFHFLSSGNCVVSMELSSRQTFKSFLIFFDDKTLTNFYLKYDAKSKISGKNSIAREPYLAFQKDAFVRNYIASLDVLSRKDVSPEMKLLKFEELMLHLLEKHPARLRSFQYQKGKKTVDTKIKMTVETNVTNAVTLAELAFLCDLSLSTFKRHFARIYGVSPSKWLLQKRMEIAKDLLQYHDQKPGQVYHQVGYENHSSFTQSFRQLFGLTPKEFQLRQLAAKR